MQPSIWFTGSDMLVTLSSARSSTMSAGTYLNSSTGVTAQVWNSPSTASASNLKTSGTLTYVTASNGTYQLVVQSTAHGMVQGDAGMVIVRVAHAALGLNREWRVPFRVEYDRG